MTLKQRRRCKRCGGLFTPHRDNYWYCETCHQDTRSLGFTTMNWRQGGASHRHGGISRLRDDRRPLVLRGDKTRKEIITGLAAFLQDLYHCPTRLSTLLQEEGITLEQIRFLSDSANLNNFVIRFCPKLREWLVATVGLKATDILIEFYGLYGEPRQPSRAIATYLGLGESDITKLRLWALKQLRVNENNVAFREMAVTVARSLIDEWSSETKAIL